jgi:hypothetical protein
MTPEEMASEGFTKSRQCWGIARRGKTWEFLIKWLGYDETTWEPLSHLTASAAMRPGQQLEESTLRYCQQHGLAEVLDQAG